MDNLMTDNSNIKLQLNDLLEKSLLNIDKRNSLINKELERIREEYIAMMEKGSI